MEYRILGPLEVEGPGGRLRIRGAKTTALLAALLTEPNHVISVERLIDSVWGEEPTEGALNTLHVSVSRLRRTLTQGAQDQRVRLVTHTSGYLLRLDRGELDLEVFRERVQCGRTGAAAGKFQDAEREFEAAVAMWRGPALATVQRPFATALASVLDDERLDALEWLMEVRLALGRDAELIPDARNLLIANPLRERLRGLLMTALYRSGRQTEALEVFREAREELVKELGIEPGPELQLLHRRILNNDETLLARTEAQAAPKVRIPRQLPADVARFVGREAELTELGALLAQPSPQSMVISVVAGTGGVGKTALAVHWAHRLLGQFPDGQLYVDFRGFSAETPMAPTEALARFLRAMGVPPAQVPVDIDEQAALYRSVLAGKRMLILLDNVATVGQVRPLLPGTPDCLVIVTSRNDLRPLSAMHDAHRLVLDALSPAEAVDLLSHMVGGKRVASEPEAADDVARLCARLPLALRIAAANLSDRPGLQLAHAASELAAGNPLHRLELPGDPELAVRATFDHSYARLDPASQRLFRLLGRIPGPDFSIEAVAALTDQSLEDAARGMERLAVAHLIESSAPGRYRFHDLLRHYARERVAIEHTEDGTPLERLLDWYLQTAYRATGILNPHHRRIFQMDPPKSTFPPLEFDDHKRALAWCERERPNLVAAVRVAVENGHDVIGYQLPATLWYYFLLRRHLNDWVATHRIGLAAAVRQGDRYGEAWMYNGLGGAYRELGRYEEAIDSCLKARVISIEVGDRRGESANLHNCGQALQKAGRLEEALPYFRQALVIRREGGDQWGEAVDLTLIGEVSRLLGRFEEALENYQAAYTLWRVVGLRLFQANALNGIGEIHRVDGRFDESIASHREALELRRAIGDQWGEFESLDNLGQALAGSGRTEQAADCWRQALAIYTERQHPRAAGVRSRLGKLEGQPTANGRLA